MMMPILAIVPIPQNIWTKVEFDRFLTRVLGEEAGMRRAAKAPPLTADEVSELTHVIVRNVIAEVLPAGNA